MLLHERLKAKADAWIERFNPPPIYKPAITLGLNALLDQARQYPGNAKYVLRILQKDLREVLKDEYTPTG